MCGDLGVVDFRLRRRCFLLNVATLNFRAWGKKLEKMGNPPYLCCKIFYLG